MLIFLILLLVALVPILIANLKGSLNRYSISVLKLSEASIKKGYYQIHFFDEYHSYLAKEIDFRSEWSAAPILLTILSLVTGISPIVIKVAPFGILMIPTSLLLARCFKLSGYQAIAYGILVGFSTMMINNNDYSQFLMGYLSLFVPLFFWARAVFDSCDARKYRIVALLLFALFFVILEYYYTTAFLFLIFATTIQFISFLQKKFNILPSNKTRLYSHLLIALWVMFLGKVVFFSIFCPYYFGHRNLTEEFSSSISRLLNIVSSIFTGNIENVAQIYPRISSFTLLLTNALVISVVVFSILMWLIWDDVRRSSWFYIGIGIISMIILEYISYLFAGHLGIYSLLTRTFILFGLLLSLHVIGMLSKKRKIGMMTAIFLTLLLFVGQVGGWIVRIEDEKVYQAGPDIGGYQIHVPVCSFSVAASKNGQKILTSHDLQFLVMAFGDITRAQDISDFGKYATIFDSHVPLPKGVIVVFSTLFGDIKPLFVTQDVCRQPSTAYLLNLESSIYLDKVYDDGIGVTFYSNG